MSTGILRWPRMAKRKKKAVWISYDLGLRGDYESLYAWLDQHDAVECGDSLAFLTYEHTGGDLVEAVAADLSEAIEIGKRTRIYVIYRDPETTKVKGRFVVGGRRSPPWSGFADRSTPPDESDV